MPPNRRRRAEPRLRAPGSAAGPTGRIQCALLALSLFLTACASTSVPDTATSTQPTAVAPDSDQQSPLEITASEISALELIMIERQGGATTTDDSSPFAFTLAAPGLTDAEREAFRSGEVLFNRPWVVAPARATQRDGLGPLFNAQACAACHIRNGRGLPPHPTSQLIPLGLLLRLSVPGQDPVTGGPLPDPVYGLQLQDRSGLAMAAEGKLSVSYDTIFGTYGDGTTWLLEDPTYTVTDLGFGSLDPAVMTSPRFAQQIFGMGLLEAIPDAAIIAASDPDDADGDGISGRVNEVWDPVQQTTVIGRFGWKANVATLRQQVADAFHDDLGISSGTHPEQNCPPSESLCLDAPTGAPDGGPELTESQLNDVTFYNQTLAVPAARDTANDEVKAGADAFAQFGCAACHTPELTTGPSEVAVLDGQLIAPYTDLLLHDMGPGLADGRPDYLASGSEWRTAPLWGLGLLDDVSGERFLLHDGRAASIEEAILWHGGEAEPAREAFRLAPGTEREQLLAFLEAL